MAVKRNLLTPSSSVTGKKTTAVVCDMECRQEPI
jgi:hypothetical protein